jgi:hypothetical protein
MMDLYVQMIQKYLRERDSIPKENLLEVRYEDFITQPLLQIKNIYESFQLPGFQNSESAFKEYINSQLSFKKDSYSIDEALQQKIMKKWGFAIKQFGY